MIKPFDTGGYFPIHNYLFDVCMRELSNAGWRVLCVAVRQTLGWVDSDSDTGRKEWDKISYSQFREKTGLASDSTVKKGIEECLGKGYLLRVRSRGPHGNAYSLNRDYEVESTTETVEQEKHYRNCSASTTETVEVSTTETVETKVKSLNENSNIPSGPDGPPVPTSLEGWLKQVETPPKGSNRTAQLVAMFEALFPGKDLPEFSYMGAVAKRVGGGGRMAQLLWQTAGARITGDPMRYAQGIHKGSGARNGRAKKARAKQPETEKDRKEREELRAEIARVRKKQQEEAKARRQRQEGVVNG